MHRFCTTATIAALYFLMAPAFAGEAPPSVDTLKQVLEKRLLSLKPTGHTERQVLFEDVRPGKASGGTYPFQVTATVRDYGPGYPANKFYGETCVGRMEKWPFELSRDSFGEWQVQGRMTITDSQCKANPAAGESSLPLATLKGTPAPAAGGPAQPKAAAKPQQTAATSGGAPRPGAYECWAFNSPRMGLNFTLQPGGRYLDSENKSGSYTVDFGTGKVNFKGGALDGQSPVYHQPGGKPTVSFRNNQGREMAFCEHAGRG